jgi:hypothetical protein
MAGAGTVYSGLKIRGLDSLHIVTEENPSCHLPHVHGKFAHRVALVLRRALHKNALIAEREREL